jgi:beta-glucosidase
VHPNLDLVGTDDVSEMVQDSIILAENKNGLLPLDATKVLQIHVTGPTANSLPAQCGGWTQHWQGPPSTNQDNNDKKSDPNDNWFTYGSTVWDSLHAESKWDVTYSCGVDFLGKDCEDPDEKHPPDESIIDQFKHWAGLTPTTSMAMAVQDAKDADVTIICLGEEPYAEKPGDIRSLRLPVGQTDLVHAIRRNTNTKIILVYFGGRPRLLADIVDSVDGVILAFLPGPDGGSAVVDIIAGRVNPNGRLPITYPAAEDGGGVPYWHAVTDMCTNGDEETTLPHYEYVPCPVQWPFGHGLSYTTFEYSGLSAIGGIDEDLHVTVTVKNTGNRAGKETVLFFTFDESRLTTPEQKRLRAFEKLSLAAGQSVTIKKTVPLEELLFVGPHDAEHYIYDPHMVSFLGIGSSINCRRRDDNDHGPDENDLCVRLQSKAPDKPYFGHCDVACGLWKDSGCLAEFGWSEKKCSETCISSSDLSSTTIHSWGWNYVACLEQVVWDFEKNGDDKKSCWMMTSFCRDIFQNDPAITRNGPSNCAETAARGTIGFYLALLSSAVASAIIFQLMFGTFGQKPRRTEDEEERFRGIQFTTIRNGSNYV